MDIALLSVRAFTITGVTDMTAGDINDRGQVIGQYKDADEAAHGSINEDDSFCRIDYNALESTRPSFELRSAFW